MVVRLRFQRHGSRNRPFYRIVAADQRARRDGRYIELLGTYDPIPDSKRNAKYLRLKSERVKYWLSVGAQPSRPVQRLLGQFGILPMPPHRNPFIVDMTDYLPEEERPQLKNRLSTPDHVKELREKRFRDGPAPVLKASDIPKDHILVRNDEQKSWLPENQSHQRWDESTTNAFLDHLAAQTFHLARFRDQLPDRKTPTIAEHQAWMDEIFEDPIGATGRHSGRPNQPKHKNPLDYSIRRDHQMLWDLHANSNVHEVLDMERDEDVGNSEMGLDKVEKYTLMGKMREHNPELSDYEIQQLIRHSPTLEDGTYETLLDRENMTFRDDA